MSSENEHLNPPSPNKPMPLYKNWLVWMAFSPFLCFTLFVILQLIIHEPGSQRAQKELETEFGLFTSPPQSIQQKVDVYRKPGTDLVSVKGYYTTSLGLASIHTYYDHEFEQNSWAFSSEKNTPTVHTRYYCKGKYTAVLEYSNQEYTLGFTQGYYRDCVGGKMSIIDSFSVLAFSLPFTVLGSVLGWFTFRDPDFLAIKVREKWIRPSPLTGFVAFGLTFMGLIGIAASVHSLWLYIMQK